MKHELPATKGRTASGRSQMLGARMFLIALALLVAAAGWGTMPTLAQFPAEVPAFNGNARRSAGHGSQVCNVKVSGAHGDGVRDETAVINAAATAAGAAGRLLLPPGTDLLSSRLQLTGADIRSVFVPTGLRPAEADESWVAHRSRRLLSRCMRLFAGALRRGAYLPTEGVGTYDAPPLRIDGNRVFDPARFAAANQDGATAIASSSFASRNRRPHKAGVCAIPRFSGLPPPVRV